MSGSVKRLIRNHYDFIPDDAIIHHVLFVFVMRDRPLPPPTPLSSNMREKLLREARRYDSTMHRPFDASAF